MRNPLLLMMILATGCSTMRGPAEAAYAHGDYVGAADLYDRIVQGDPHDANALAKRQQARNSALSRLLFNEEAARQAGRTEEAVADLDELLRRRDGWGMAIEPAQTAALATEVSAIGATLDASIAERTRSAGPLAAKQLAHRYDPLLARADFARERDHIYDELRTAGQASCTARAADATTPYVSWLVADYCREFGVARDPVALPNLRGELAVAGAIVGESDVLSAQARAALADAFRGSVWYARGAEPAHAQLDGHISVGLSSKLVTLSRPWTESVPYTESETSQEEYQEPYPDTESYSEQVPYTEARVEVHPCAYNPEAPCPESVPYTLYRTEWKTRTVTKWRGVWRTVTVPVTKYRDEERSFQYQATQQTAEYVSALHVRVDLMPEVAATIDSHFSDSSYTHDVTFSAAGVAPERAKLMSLDAFVAREQGRLHDQLRAALDARYAQLYCSASTYTVEQAAACAYLDPQHTPSAARAALRTVFGDDEPFLSAIASDRISAPKGAADKATVNPFKNKKASP